MFAPRLDARQPPAASTYPVPSSPKPMSRSYPPASHRPARWPSRPRPWPRHWRRRSWRPPPPRERPGRRGHWSNPDFSRLDQAQCKRKSLLRPCRRSSPGRGRQERKPGRPGGRRGPMTTQPARHTQAPSSANTIDHFMDPSQCLLTLENGSLIESIEVVDEHVIGDGQIYASTKDDRRLKACEFRQCERGEPPVAQAWSLTSLRRRPQARHAHLFAPFRTRPGKDGARRRGVSSQGVGGY